MGKGTIRASSTARGDPLIATANLCKQAEPPLTAGNQGPDSAKPPLREDQLKAPRRGTQSLAWHALGWVLRPQAAHLYLMVSHPWGLYVRSP